MSFDAVLVAGERVLGEHDEVGGVAGGERPWLASSHAR